MTSFIARLAGAVMHWRPLLSCSGPVVVVFGSIVAGDPNHLDAAYYEQAGQRETPTLFQRIESIDHERVLLVIGDALSPFTTSAGPFQQQPSEQ